MTGTAVAVIGSASVDTVVLGSKSVCQLGSVPMFLIDNLIVL